MTEKEELKVSKIIIRNCVKVQNTRTVFDGQYVIIDIFRLLEDIDIYYQNKKQNNG